MKHYFSKFKAQERSPARPKWTHAFSSALGGLIGISAIALLTEMTKTPLLMAPFGATCVLAFGVSDSPLAQPRNIIGGHVISATIGLICLNLFGDSWYSMAIGVGLSLAAMQLTKTVHPPAGANPLVIVLSHAKWSFIFTPVLLGAVILVVVALFFNNAHKTRKYPRYWR
ncbi:HPP family protein [Flectobacillus major]|jgi:CBS-domain-containing membrane protein|uniref:HPP family protein n=1 Tax=Flectobacillus major TaxID=103 RepID=UPI000406A2E9|nr:HPP family protein [Flectobacillus major]